MLVNQKIRIRSRINQYFDPDLMFQIEKTVRYQHGLDTNGTGDKVFKFIHDKIKDAQVIGPGTNRYSILIDGYCVKIALNEDGIIDNMKEFRLSKELYPDVIKVYEMSLNGIVIMCEYVTVFDNQKFRLSQDDMRKILHRISERFFIGDIGISDANYLNWGYREDGTICVLDFAYAYRVSFKKFICGCSPLSKITYDNNYNYLVCESCGRKYTFGEMRTKLDNNDILSEIGDLTKMSYRIEGSDQLVNRNTDWSPRPGDEKLIKKEEEAKAKKLCTNDDTLSLDEYIEKIQKGEIKI